MFWNKNKKSKKQDKRPSKDKSVGDKSQRIREEALANARAARENIGEDTLDRIAEAMTRRQQNIQQQVKQQVAEADAQSVAAEILAMYDEGK